MSEIKEVPGIIIALQNVMNDIEAIGKDARNEEQKFNFRSIDAVYNEIHDLFAKHSIICLPDYQKHDTEVYNVPTRGGNKTRVHRVVKIKYTFLCSEDNSSKEIMAIGEGADFGDKSLSKALSIADKYALLQVFKIPTEDNKDPDGQSFADPATAAQIQGCISYQQQSNLVDSCANVGYPLGDLLAHYQINHVKFIKAGQYDKIIGWLSTLGSRETNYEQRH